MTRPTPITAGKMRYSLSALTVLLLAVPPWMAAFGMKPSWYSLSIAVVGCWILVFTGLGVANGWLDRRGMS